MNFDYKTVLFSLPAVLIGLTIHEFFHAFVASRLGDTTAKEQGRLTLNPIKHIDLLGMVFLIFAGFGWAKPVSINRTNLKNPRRDEILISIAGPLSNLVLGIIFIYIFRLLGFLFPYTGEPVQEIIYNMIIYSALLNFGLFVFNIIPIPPLDGSHVLFNTAGLSYELQAKLMKYGAYALIIIIIVERKLNVSILPIGKVVKWLMKLFV